MLDLQFYICQHLIKVLGQPSDPTHNLSLTDPDQNKLAILYLIVLQRLKPSNLVAPLILLFPLSFFSASFVFVFFFFYNFMFIASLVLSFLDLRPSFLLSFFFFFFLFLFFLSFFGFPFLFLFLFASPSSYLFFSLFLVSFLLIRVRTIRRVDGWIDGWVDA